ncbi:MAG TPA: DUF4129 domain-containing protein [Gaiellaceae bacterium]|nr:DUF4129 domain-containing protein [Gaiellaceae bacterium]
MESSQRGRNALLTTLGVLLGLVVVAVAARGSTSAGDGTTRKPSDALLDAIFTLYLLAMVGGAVLFVYLLVLHRRVRTESGRGKRRSLIEMLFTFAVLVGASALFARRIASFNRPLPVEPEEAIGRIDSLPAHASADPAAPYQAEIAWLPVLITVALIVLAAGAWWYSGRARRRARGELPAQLAAAFAQAVDESLDDLRSEPDPRRAVIAAYARLERVLTAHGLPRKPSDAPAEYLARMLEELSVTQRAARRLTDLFERAKFSQHAVGIEMKLEAISALETVRDDLLAARALAEQEREAEFAAQRKRTAT